MKRFLIFTLSITMSLVVTSQTFFTQAKPYGDKLWGYINQDGEMIIKPKYKKCYPFSNSGVGHDFQHHENEINLSC